MKIPLFGLSALALLTLAGGAAVVAQSISTSAGSPAFDVASVKRSQPGASRDIMAMAMGAGQVALRPGGRLAAPSVTLRDLVRAAYNVLDIQVIGGPGWVTTDRFDIEATTRADVTADEARTMLRALLRERFGLSAHTDTRELTVTALESARDDGRLGPQLRRSGPECASTQGPAALPFAPAPPPPPPGAGRPLLLTADVLRCPSMALIGHLSLRETTMAQFASRLVPLVGRMVIDRTRLTGPFDLDLTYTPDPGTAPLMVNGAAVVFDAPALPAAVRDQLGLKLETSKSPVAVVVIDRAEPPTEN